MRYDFARRGLRPTAEMLAGTGQINLSTSLGALDPLCELDVGQGYDELVKTKAGRPKDRLALPILIATSQERDKGKR